MKLKNSSLGAGTTEFDASWFCKTIISSCGHCGDRGARGDCGHCEDRRHYGDCRAEGDFEHCRVSVDIVVSKIRVFTIPHPIFASSQPGAEAASQIFSSM